jgi:hypothetical protein
MSFAEKTTAPVPMPASRRVVLEHAWASEEKTRGDSLKFKSHTGLGAKKPANSTLRNVFTLKPPNFRAYRYFSMSNFHAQKDADSFNPRRSNLIHLSKGNYIVI